MPGLTGLPALDVAIGLSFIFLLLSLVASAGQEIIANLLGLRARTLEKGLRKMLADPAPSPGNSAVLRKADGTLKQQPEGDALDLRFAVYAHPLIRSLYREGRRWIWFGHQTLTDEAKPPARDPADKTKEPAAAKTIDKARLPSYIAPRSFAVALLDTIAPQVLLTNADGTKRADHDVIRETREAIAKLTIPEGVKHRLLSLLDEARGNVDAFRTNIEAWFDDSMARVSGWYKRLSQLFIVLMAVGVTLALNANALTMGERLWRDPALRAAVVQQAGSATSETEGKTARDRLNKAVDNVEDVAKLGVPIGWAQSKPDDPRHIDLGTLGGFFHGIGGWLLTILAVSMGAPFWFDALSRLSRLRGTGKPETPLPATGSGKPGERVVTGAAPVSVQVQHLPAIAAAAAVPGAQATSPPAPAPEP